jgi:hypothetical protein
MREDIINFINEYLAMEGLSLDESELDFPILGEKFEEHDEADEFVGRVLHHYQVKVNGWIAVESFNDLINYIVKQHETRLH